MMNAKRVSNNVLISTNDVCMLAPMSSTNFVPTLSGRSAIFFTPVSPPNGINTVQYEIT